MSEGIYNKKLYPREDELPKFITMIGHDGEGNLHEVRYINMQILRIMENEAEEHPECQLKAVPLIRKIARICDDLKE